MEQIDHELRRQCRRALSYHLRESPREILTRLAIHPLAENVADYFGKGTALHQLERGTADLLGKEEAQYFHKGIIAQQCLLRSVSESSTSLAIALAPMSHIDFEEGNALEAVHGLRVVRLGRNSPFRVKDLSAVGDKLAAVVIELPLRRAGYLMPSWDELGEMSKWCRHQGIHLHIDGARIWEAAAGYGREPREVASLGDSVYVSYYKGLGGLAGCALAGSSDLIRMVQPWRTRLGGIMSTAYPYVLSALDGIDRHLPRIEEYVHRARALASRISGICVVNPPIPHTNAFQVLLKGTPAELVERHRSFASSDSVWLFNSFTETQLPQITMAEIVIGSAADLYTDDEACEWLNSFVK